MHPALRLLTQVKHDSGVWVVYGEVSATVKNGARVKAGQKIGTVAWQSGWVGRQPGPCDRRRRVPLLTWLAAMARAIAFLGSFSATG